MSFQRAYNKYLYKIYTKEIKEYYHQINRGVSWIGDRLFRQKTQNYKV